MLTALILAGQAAMPINCLQASSAEREIAHLNRTYGEVPIFTGITDGDEASVMILMASPTGSYTLLLVQSDGSSCLLVTGFEIAPWPMGDRG